MSEHQPVAGKVLTLPFLFLGVLGAIGLYFIGVRFVDGMGAVANINSGYPWGIWVVYDVVVGTALACGGYALAFVIYLFNKGQYHPLIRPAILASLFGYALGGFGAFFDMGRYWQFYNILLPSRWNFNSVMLEVGLCVITYICVLAIEFAPALLERFGAKNALRHLNRVLFFFIALGLLLPSMHQSSLGSLLIVMGAKVHPLWQSLQWQPLLALMTALIMGFSIVIFEASFSAAGFNRTPETPLLARLGKVINGLIAVFLVVRLAELLLRDKLGFAFTGDLAGNMFLLEMLLFIFPLLVMLSRQRENPRSLLFAAVSLLFAGALYRFNAYLIAYNPGPGYSYFPSVPEIMVTVGIVAIEIMAYLVFVKKLPVLHSSEDA